MKAFRQIALVASLAVLGGCTAFNSFTEVEALNEAQPLGSAFTVELAKEYRLFANRELNEMFDYPDALHFARKGLAAASGEVVLPEPVTDWNLSENHVREMTAARGRLMNAFRMGAREMNAVGAARAQAKFDCWIEEQEEVWQTSEIEGCKVEFFNAIKDLEASMVPPEPQQVETIEEAQDLGVYDIDPAEPMKAEDAMYLVFFNWDSHVLDDTSMNVLGAVAEQIAQTPPETVNVVGHTDTSGTKAYNQKLALKRANAVKKALTDKGVDGALMNVDAKGETELLVATPDDVREPANRRVNIAFQ